MTMESFSGFGLAFMPFDLEKYNLEFRHTVLVMFIVLSFCLSIFFSLLLLVVVVVLLTRDSFYNFNLSNKHKRDYSIPSRIK